MLNGIKMLGYRNSEKCIKELMLIRRTFELLGIDAKEFDKKLEEWTERYFEEFSNMNQTDLMILMDASMKGDE